MKWERGDLAVGTFVVLAVAALAGGYLWLSPVLGEDEFAVHAEFARVDGVADQAPVQIAGYPVGRVEAIEPHVGADGAVRFRVRLALAARLPSGEPLRLPSGTVAHLAPPTLSFGQGLISLEPRPGSGFLADGATIPGVVADDALARVQSAADTLTREVHRTLVSARALMDSLSATTATARQAAQITATSLPRLIATLERDLAAAGALTETARTQLATLGPAATASLDTAALLLADSRRLVASLDRMSVDRGREIEGLVANLDTTTMILNHFVRAGARRPWRFVTGVRPPPELSGAPKPRTASSSSAADTVGGDSTRADSVGGGG